MGEIEMFNNLFPIFCFGLVITGIVFLGIMEASTQAKAQALQERKREIPEELPSITTQSRNGSGSRSNLPLV